MIRFRPALVITLGLLFTTAYSILCRINGTEFKEQASFFTFVLFPVVGAILLARHPQNRTGHLTSFLGLSVMGASTLFEYAKLQKHAIYHGVPFTGEAALGALTLWNFVLPTLVFILLLFPNGRLLSPRWKYLGIFTVLVTAPLTLALLVVGWRNRDDIVLSEYGRFPLNTDLVRLYKAFDIWALVIIAAVTIALISFFLRFARSGSIERQQLKWFVLGLTTIPISLIMEQVVLVFDSPAMLMISWVLNIVSISAFPLVMLIAITRYRLYDIDFIIRRTLLYSTLTLTLALLYFGLILLLQRLFTQWLGEQSGFVIVISTLLIAALFQPMRRRFQAVIDRRFYRSKYDAEQTMERFAVFLQSEVDMDAINRQFLEIVEENIQPEQASLWVLKPGPERQQ